MEWWQWILIILSGSVGLGVVVLWITVCQVMVIKEKKNNPKFHSWDEATGRHD